MPSIYIQYAIVFLLLLHLFVFCLHFGFGTQSAIHSLLVVLVLPTIICASDHQHSLHHLYVTFARSIHSKCKPNLFNCQTSKSFSFQFVEVNTLSLSLSLHPTVVVVRLIGSMLLRFLRAFRHQQKLTCNFTNTSN